jgi:hypothetical protein
MASPTTLSQSIAPPRPLRCRRFLIALPLRILYRHESRCGGRSRATAGRSATSTPVPTCRWANFSPSQGPRCEKCSREQ